MKTHGYFQNTASSTIFIKYKEENTVLQEENATKEWIFLDFLVLWLFNYMLIECYAYFLKSS